MFHPTSPQAPNMPQSISGWAAFKHRIGRDPLNDWMVILACSILLVVASVVIGINMYFNVQTTLDNNSANNASAQIAIIKPENLTKVLNEFDARAQKYSLILKGYTGPRDPSI